MVLLICPRLFGLIYWLARRSLDLQESKILSIRSRSIRLHTIEPFKMIGSSTKWILFHSPKTKSQIDFRSQSSLLRNHLPFRNQKRLPQPPGVELQRFQKDGDYIQMVRLETVPFRNHKHLPQPPGVELQRFQKDGTISRLYIWKQSQKEIGATFLNRKKISTMSHRS